MRGQMTLAIFCVLLVSACSEPDPPIARDLPKSFGPTPDFDKRIKQQYPIGSDETRLLTDLRNERFSIVESHDPSSPYRLSANYKSGHFPCGETWIVQWTGEHGKINDVAGHYSGKLCF